MTLDQLLDRLLGPWGAFVLALGVIYFLWKLFRESQAETRVENRADRVVLEKLAATVADLAGEVREMRKERERWDVADRR